MGMTKIGTRRVPRSSLLSSLAEAPSLGTRVFPIEPSPVVSNLYVFEHLSVGFGTHNVIFRCPWNGRATIVSGRLPNMPAILASVVWHTERGRRRQVYHSGYRFGATFGSRWEYLSPPYRLSSPLWYASTHFPHLPLHRGPLPPSLSFRAFPTSSPTSQQLRA